LGGKNCTRGKEPLYYIIIQVDKLPVDRMIDAILNGKFVQGVHIGHPVFFVIFYLSVTYGFA
jgi:hypothetical protein